VTEWQRKEKIKLEKNRLYRGPICIMHIGPYMPTYYIVQIWGDILQILRNREREREREGRETDRDRQKAT